MIIKKREVTVRETGWSGTGSDCAVTRHRHRCRRRRFNQGGRRVGSVFALFACVLLYFVCLGNFGRQNQNLRGQVTAMLQVNQNLSWFIHSAVQLRFRSLPLSPSPPCLAVAHLHSRLAASVVFKFFFSFLNPSASSSSSRQRSHCSIVGSGGSFVIRWPWLDIVPGVGRD